MLWSGSKQTFDYIFTINDLEPIVLVAQPVLE